MSAGPYFHDWANADKKSMLADFCEEESALDGAEVIVASYTYECYSGEAYVLFRRDGKLYEVHASHCSCYGLEDQWSPEETSAEEILFCLDRGTWGQDDGIADLIRAALTHKEG